MGFWVADTETEALAHELARQRGVPVEEALKQAVISQLPLQPRPLPPDPESRRRRREAIRATQDEIASWGKTGLKADKAFFDELAGEPD